MLKLNDFRAYIKSIETAIAEITSSQTVMDESQLSKFLNNQITNTRIVLGIIPKHKFIGNEVNVQSKDIISILVLQKVVRSSLTQELFLDELAESQRITQLVVDKILADYENEDSCGIMRQLLLSSFDINPIWELNSCDGYQIDFSLKNDI
ncbi:MAG: hypothetical protein ACSHXA_07610 [Polaribacter sp.]|uniref:hypothetical protein n=1 Tax=Polaribacter sp. TaxID=1920175 RepID=UPI003EF3BC02